MAKIRIKGDTSGYIDLAAPAVAGTTTVNLDKVPQTDQVANFTSNVNVTGQVNATISSQDNPAGYFRNTSGSGNSPALVARGGANNTTAPTFEVQDYNGNVDFKVDGNGYVTKPNQPAFTAYSSTGTLHITTGTFPLQDTVLNVGNHYNTSTYTFTAPVSGIYKFVLSALVSSGGHMSLRRNGAYSIGASGGASGIHQVGASYTQVCKEFILSLAANDSVTAHQENSNGVYRDWVVLTGALIS